MRSCQRGRVLALRTLTLSSSIQSLRAPGRERYLILCILFAINFVSCRPAAALSIIVQSETTTLAEAPTTSIEYSYIFPHGSSRFALRAISANLLAFFNSPSSQSSVAHHVGPNPPSIASQPGVHLQNSIRVILCC